jgi:hypothetical protein
MGAFLLSDRKKVESNLKQASLFPARRAWLRWGTSGDSRCWRAALMSSPGFLLDEPSMIARSWWTASSTPSAAS